MYVLTGILLTRVYYTELHAARHGPTFLSARGLVRAGKPGRTVFNCQEVPIKEYLLKWNFVTAFDA